MNKIPLMNLQRMHEQIMPEIKQAVNTVLDSGRFINGPEVKEFEQKFAKLAQLDHVIGCSNGTDAIMVLLKALEIGPGDEVILPTMTFIATAEAVTMVGARVVLVDVEPNTYCLDIEAAQKAINPRTKAIIAVHLHGNVANVEKLAEITEKNNIYLIEDSAQAHLGKLNNKPIGSFGIAATFSFFPGKNLGAMGDAGAIGTNDEKLALKLRKLINHGRLDKYKHDLEGYNMRMDTLQAAILNIKVDNLKAWTELRRQKADIYRELLDDIASPPDPLSKFGEGEVVPPFHAENVYNVYHLFVIRVKNRDVISEKLKEAGIECGVHYPIPLHLQPAYEYLAYKQGNFPVAEQCAEEFLSLPLCPVITREEQEFVVNSLKKIL